MRLDDQGLWDEPVASDDLSRMQGGNMGLRVALLLWGADDPLASPRKSVVV